MNKKILLAFSITAALSISTSITEKAYTNSNGAPSGKAGNPASSNGSCVSCHGEALSTSPSVVIEVSQSGTPITSSYTPGVTYDVTISRTGGSTAQSGFTMASENSAGLIGSWTPGTGSKFCSGTTDYVTHSTPKNGTPHFLDYAMDCSACWGRIGYILWRNSCKQSRYFQKLNELY